MSDAPRVVLVDPSEPGNVGTAARAMKNFGFEDLRLIDPPALDRDGEAYGFAAQAREDVLPAATETTFEAVVESHYTVGFTARPGTDARRHVRYPAVPPAAVRDELAGLDASVALVFGRERIGLTNDELGQLDRVCTIPADPAYPSLNLGQAVTVALYELRGLSGVEPAVEIHERAPAAEIERLHDRFEGLLLAVGHPVEKRTKAMRLWRRLLGRAHPTEREVRTLTGVFRRAADFVEHPGGD
ncbi:MAG: RNA methyltransferase [Halobacteriales archaeon]